ncbi:MAG: ABC transporter substrate-binding protein [Termitinemataceae bacterium]|nr:MAG: ABC transporter substrate-binding protein [Termitinemataceae bacterium]
MKKMKPHQIVSDDKRLELDFLGKIYCPFKLSFKRAWDDFAASHTDLRIAVPSSMKDETFNDLSVIKDFRKFPAIVTDSGYDEFFGKKFIADAERHERFSNQPFLHHFNKLSPIFKNLNLRDPKNIFTIFAVMPYILVVNHDRLKGRSVPRMISDLSKSEYEKSLGSLYSSNDITEHLLLEIYKEQGEEGIRSLARNIGLGGRAPSLIEDAVSKDGTCCVYVMSLNFAASIPAHESLEIIWPQDGALFCPLYAIAKKEIPDAQRAKNKITSDFLFSSCLAEVLSENNLIPVHSEAQLHLPKNTPDDAHFRWVGWDYIYEMPLAKRVQQIEEILAIC